jgi:hypothetical protein
MRSVDDDYKLEDLRLIDVIDEHPDRVRHQIVTVFPNFALQETQNAMALRFFTPKDVDRTNLEWIYFGYADDTPEMRKRRLRHLNLGGPAGFVSMEDGCVSGFVERGIATAEKESAIVEMGGAGADGIASETPFLVLRIMRDGRTDLFASGIYVDRICEEGGNLRFAQRIVVCDSGHFDTLLAIPL